MKTRNLFDYTRRPAINDDDMLREAALVIAEKIRDGWSNFEDGDDYGDIVEDLVYAMDNATTSDGFDICKRLERKGWYPDSELVEIFDEGDLHTAHRKAVVEWVKIFNIQPEFAVGETVTTRHGPGPITSINEETAEYAVHVKLPEDTKPHNYLFGYETVTRLDVDGK